MKPRVENFIKNCVKCIVYSAPPRTNNRKMYSITKTPVPLDTLHIDHLGPLPNITSRKKYILVVIDAFTKFTKLYATATTNTNEVCEALTQYMSYYSRPKRIISDRATCFTSTAFKEFVDSNDITHVLNATGSPQANGQVERVNRVLRPILSKLCNSSDHSDWSSHLRSAEHALNNTVHSSTNFLPSILLFGIEQRGQILDELHEFLNDKDVTTKRDLNLLRSEALSNIEYSQYRNEQYVANRTKPAPSFSEGDLVAIKYTDSTNANKKLVCKFRGPYIVHKVLPHDRYVIRDVDGFQITQMPYDGVLEVDKLRKWSNNI